MNNDVKQLHKSRSLLFHLKKMKSLNNLFATTPQPQALRTTSSLARPTSPLSTTFHSATMCQYPPKPLVYSDAISPPPDDVILGASSASDRNQSSHQRMVMPLNPASSSLPQGERRSSAPALASNGQRSTPFSKIEVGPWQFWKSAGSQK
ncbi:hypothetical protein BX666DRAFT_2029435 [Dichotomocladium elegans]|nr:hypothetical protein BX666DRAFT_2029435 [Dichotomocladium elegans]